METSCTFHVEEFVAGEWEPEIRTALGTGNARMVKVLEGGLSGQSVTQFSFCFDNDTGVGSYVATESFDGTVDGRRGTFNFIHLVRRENRQQTTHICLGHRLQIIQINGRFRQNAIFSRS